KQRLLSQWGDVLSGLSREGSPVRRLQWIERTLPEPGDGIPSYFRDRVALTVGARPVQSYLQLVEAHAPSTQRHETLLVVQISPGRAKRLIQQAGGGEQGACTVLAREVFALAQRVQAAELDVDGVLTPRLLAQSLRVAFDPEERRAVAARAVARNAMPGIAPSEAWPMHTQTTWHYYRTDSAFHATYWIAEWPRTEVGPDFLAP